MGRIVPLLPRWAATPEIASFCVIIYKGERISNKDIAAMRSNIVKNKAKQEALQRDVDLHHENARNWGETIRYEMPGIPLLFVKLPRAIYETEHRHKFVKISYYLETKNGYIKKLIPASEYYKLAFKAISDKYYVLTVSVEAGQKSIDRLQNIYRDRVRNLVNTGQASIQMNEEVYQL